MLQIYDIDKLNFKWRVYFNKSEKDGNITIATINFNWNKKKCLKSVNVTFTRHNKFKNWIMIVEKLINYCKKQLIRAIKFIKFISTIKHHWKWFTSYH